MAKNILLISLHNYFRHNNPSPRNKSISKDFFINFIKPNSKQVEMPDDLIEMIECVTPCIDIDLWICFRNENDLIIVEKQSTIRDEKQQTVINTQKEYENYEPEDVVEEEDSFDDMDEEEMYFFIGKKLRR